MGIDVRPISENDPRAEQVFASNRARDEGLNMREKQCRRTGKWFARLETQEGRAVTEFESSPDGTRAGVHKRMSERGKGL